MNITKEQMVEAFTEWDRRYREDPEAFQNEAARLLQSDAETYGQEVTPYFINLLKELKKNKS